MVRLDEDYADNQRFAMNIGNETFFLFGDQLGSTSGVMNARWPKVREAQRRGFDPSIGRLMQADTIVSLQDQGTQAFERYAYVNNKPLLDRDEDGRWVST